jgi:hypothetical protein
VGSACYEVEACLFLILQNSFPDLMYDEARDNDDRSLSEAIRKSSGFVRCWQYRKSAQFPNARMHTDAKGLSL